LQKQERCKAKQKTIAVLEVKKSAIAPFICKQSIASAMNAPLKGASVV